MRGSVGAARPLGANGSPSSRYYERSGLPLGTVCWRPDGWLTTVVRMADECPTAGSVEHLRRSVLWLVSPRSDLAMSPMWSTSTSTR